MAILLSLCVGIGLSAACGFRVFLPLFALGLAHKFGHVPLSADFQWLSSDPALIALGFATICEIVAYFVPFFDHLLDVLHTPLAVVAGVIATAAVLNHADPWLQWSLAVIAGGSVAAATQSSTVLLRGLSTLTTAGLGNPIFALGEAVASATVSILTILFPLFVASFALLALVLIAFCWKRRQAARR